MDPATACASFSLASGCLVSNYSNASATRQSDLKASRKRSLKKAGSPLHKLTQCLLQNLNIHGITSTLLKSLRDGFYGSFMLRMCRRGRSAETGEDLPSSMTLVPSCLHTRHRDGSACTAGVPPIIYAAIIRQLGLLQPPPHTRPTRATEGSAGDGDGSSCYSGWIRLTTVKRRLRHHPRPTCAGWSFLDVLR
jgi:hypothetical protein